MAKYTAAQHKKYATIAPSSAHPEGRFPMGDANHARAALQDLPKAKGLSSAQKVQIRKKAVAKLGGK